MREIISLYLSITWFCILMNFLIVTSTAILHEFGHFIFAYLEKCEATIVAFDMKHNTYTLIKCPEQPSLLINLGGIIFTLAFSFNFLLLKLPEKSFYWVVFGLSFLLASYDLATLAQFLLMPTILFGIPWIVYGEVKFIHEKITMAERYEIF